MKLKVQNKGGVSHEGRQLVPASNSWRDEETGIREFLDGLFKKHEALKPDADTWVIHTDANEDEEFGLAQVSGIILIKLKKGTKFQFVN